MFIDSERFILIVFRHLHIKFGYGDLYVNIYENSSKNNTYFYRRNSFLWLMPNKLVNKSLRK